MDHLIDRLCRLIEGVIVMLLALMVLLVFGNVVLRYGFNSGITVSEELSRWLFIWLTFLGAVVVQKDNGHLGTDLLVSRLPPRGQRACLVLSQAIMAYLAWLVFIGSLQQARLNIDVIAPVTGASMAWFYMSGAVFALLAGGLILRTLILAATGRLGDADLIAVAESEELAALNKPPAAETLVVKGKP